MPRTKLLNGSVPVTFRLPRQVRKTLTDRAQKEAISVSELVHRALRREIKTVRTANVCK
jgi:predicted HicB family RNase H-like nuclease